MINNLPRDETEVILALLDAKCSEDDHSISIQGDDEIGWRETMSKYEKYFGNVKHLCKSKNYQIKFRYKFSRASPRSIYHLVCFSSLKV